jgi:hypothetical protein
MMTVTSGARSLREEEKTVSSISRKSCVVAGDMADLGIGIADEQDVQPGGQ